MRFSHTEYAFFSHCKCAFIDDPVAWTNSTNYTRQKDKSTIIFCIMQVITVGNTDYPQRWKFLPGQSKEEGDFIRRGKERRGLSVAVCRLVSKVIFSSGRLASNSASCDVV